MELNIAHIVACTEAEGPGKRFAIWVQGCPLRCAECCNPEMLPFDGGTPTTVTSLVERVLASRDLGTVGITLIGGEPFAHAAELAELAKQVQAADMDVMVFTGYTMRELAQMSDPAVAGFLQHIDLLVDGRYDRSQPDTSRRWIGSKNQVIHFLTDRYSAADACWKTRDTLELRWDGKDLVVNGFPARSAVDLWKANGDRR